MNAVLLFVRALVACWVFTTFGIVLLLLWSECSWRRDERDAERRMFASLTADLDALPTAPEPVLNGRHARSRMERTGGSIRVAPVEGRINRNPKRGTR